MKRKIISINEDLCNGCGDCVVGCAEGALQIINGKAKLVKEDFCDGFGDCIGACPTGALQVIEKESSPFDEVATKQNLMKTQGKEAVKKMEEAHARHQQGHASQANGQSMHDHSHHHGGGGCPGSRAINLKNQASAPAMPSGGGGAVIRSDLEQWPVQLHLVNPLMPLFNDKELVILSTCSPVASADIHWRYLRGRSVVIACPKLDKTDPYVEKLTAIFKNQTIPKVIVVRMQVPCCGGLTQLAHEALKRSGRTDLVLEEHVMSLEGELLSHKHL